MSAGQLNQVVELWERDVASSTTGSGFSIENFVLRQTDFSRVTPVKGSEPFITVERTSMVTHAFRFRYREDIDVTWRLRWRGVVFNIVDIRPFGHQLAEWIDVLAVSGPAENPIL